jgi:hypothetical protein
LVPTSDLLSSTVSPVSAGQFIDSYVLLRVGGAERLVVDAALALKKRGHDVEIFTSYHEDGKGGRSFEETRNGTF